MALFGTLASHGCRRLAGWRGRTLWVAWVAAVAFVLFQISVTLMPMPAAAAPTVAPSDPCQSMMMNGAPMDMGGDQAPAPDADHGMNATCPLMKVGGCFAICATVLPSPPAVPATERTTLTLQLIEIQGAPLIVSPPQRPPRRT